MRQLPLTMRATRVTFDGPLCWPCLGGRLEVGYGAKPANTLLYDKHVADTKVRAPHEIFSRQHGGPKWRVQIFSLCRANAH